MFLRAFPSRWVKFLAYTTSKPKILVFNNSFYNIPNIKHSIFFTISFKYSFFIISLFFNYISFSLFLFVTLNPANLTISMQQTHTHPIHHHRKKTPTTHTHLSIQQTHTLPSQPSKPISILATTTKKKKKKPTETYRDSQTQKTTASTKDKTQNWWSTETHRFIIKPRKTTASTIRNSKTTPQNPKLDQISAITGNVAAKE